jgi:acetyl-CoA carboxylase biotin carboxyl carrier protein
MDIRKIRKMIEIMKETGVTEIEIREGEESVRINCQQNVITTAAPQMMTHHVMPIAHASAEPVQVDAKTELKGTVINSPMVGTFYRSPSPGSPPFVEVGKKVKVGETLAMIEAMKMFNPIEAEVSGTITAILVENSQPVEYGQPLFTIAT